VSEPQKIGGKARPLPQGCFITLCETHNSSRAWPFGSTSSLVLLIRLPALSITTILQARIAYWEGGVIVHATVCSLH
jgi:hypothetical protein